MPGGDRRGPDGRGPMTGRRLGSCMEGTDDPFIGRTGRGMGYGRGRGRGRGLGFWRDPDPIPAVNRNTADETMELKEKIRSLEDELQRTKDRITEK